MKYLTKNTLILSGILCLSTFAAVAQNPFLGKWSGTLKLPTMTLGLIFDIQNSDDGLSATMDSPDQGAKGIPVDKVNQHGDSIFLEITQIGMSYAGKMQDEQHIDGSFTQRGINMSLPLTKGALKEKVDPQLPKLPYPYKEEKVNFLNPKTNNKLAGTLTIPEGKGPFPAIVLVSGSGPQDRNETLLGHQPFLILADYFTRNGYAVLRYDDRGVGESEGKFDNATTADFATDAEAALQYLETQKNINKKKIGMMGHSEGGAIATQLAANTKRLDFIILLAGPGMSGDQILLQQQRIIAEGAGIADSTLQQSERANKAVFDIMRSTKDLDVMKQRIRLFLNTAFNDGTLQGAENMSKEAAVDAYMDELMSPWLIYFVQYDPQVDLQKIEIPVLALIGSKDHQVLPQYNIPAIKSALEKAGNKKATVEELPGLNHLFQECKTGMPDEYQSIEQTFAPSTMQLILTWLNANVKK